MRLASLIVAVAAAAFATPLHPQSAPVGVVDVYGARTLTPGQLREALGVKVGDTLPIDRAAAVQRLRSLPNVLDADVAVVCCHQGRTIVYAGVLERGGDAPARAEARTDTALRLPDDVVATNDAFEAAMRLAIQRGDAAENTDAGHALMRDSAARAHQLRFVDFARRDRQRLRAVLTGSANATHRAIAARVLAYQDDKRQAFNDLFAATNDPSSEVRNEALRAMALIYSRARRDQALADRIAPFAGVFARPLLSHVWSDRNKGVFVLVQLTDGNERVLAQLRTREHVAALAEMARWSADGHAFPAMIVLGRIGRMADRETIAAWDAKDREKVIAAATAAVSAPPTAAPSPR